MYFSGVEGLLVRGEPRGTGPVFGRLSPYEKVHRERIERGYAYVRAEGSGLVGWVDNAKLIWQLPTKPPAGSVDGTTAPAVPPERASTTSSGMPSEVAAPPLPAHQPGKSGTTPSIFDPY